MVARCRSTTVLALGIAAILFVGLAISASCPSVPKGTLTFECDGACSSGQSCMAAATERSSASIEATTNTSDCKCFGNSTTNPSFYTSFELLIPFDAAAGATLSSLKPHETYVGNERDDTDNHAWVSDSELVTIAPLSGIPKTVTNMCVCSLCEVCTLTNG